MHDEPLAYKKARQRWNIGREDDIVFDNPEVVRPSNVFATITYLTQMVSLGMFVYSVYLGLSMFSAGAGLYGSNQDKST